MDWHYLCLLAAFTPFCVNDWDGLCPEYRLYLWGKLALLVHPHKVITESKTHRIGPAILSRNRFYEKDNTSAEKWWIKCKFNSTKNLGKENNPVCVVAQSSELEKILSLYYICIHSSGSAFIPITASPAKSYVRVYICSGSTSPRSNPGD